ncbi:uncharacterized protein [Solanum lycopersicum]|uniref:uncharacterized protein n=1 Tax=Solanum lycopersicum TaxID=4081 RepID=UPI00374A5AF3
MTNQNNQVHAHVNKNGGSMAARVRDFVRMNSPEFLGSEANEDPQNFLDEIKKIFEVMQVTGNDRVELASYQLKDLAHIWYTQWTENRGANVAPSTWDCFIENFLDMFFPIKLREEKSQEFLNLRRGNMTVQEYGLNFNQLSKNAMLFGDMNIYRLMNHAQQGQQKFSALDPSLASVSSSKNRQGQGCGNGRSQSTTSAAPTSRPSQQGYSSGTGGSQCQSRLYALQARQDQEGSPDVVTSTLRVFNLDVYAL